MNTGGGPKPRKINSMQQGSMSRSVEQSIKGYTKSPFKKKIKEPEMVKGASERPSIDIEKIITHSKHAAEKYLKSGTPMNDTISKIAIDNGYNRDQVQRITETANMITYKYLYKKATEDKNIVFDIADTNEIMKLASSKKDELEMRALGEKPDSLISTDYIRPPGFSPVVKTAEESITEKPESTNDVAIKTMKKYATIKRDVEGLPRLASLVKSAMVEGSSLKSDPQYVDNFMVIMKIARDMGVDHSVMVKVAAILGRERLLSEADLLKVASAVENPNLLADLTEGRVVNGDNILIKTLKEFKSDTDGGSCGPPGIGSKNAQIGIDTMSVVESE